MKCAKKGASRIYLTGVIPCALYGAEHFCVEQKEIGVLQKQATECGPVKPFAVPAILKLLCQDIAHDPIIHSQSGPNTQMGQRSMDGN